jgi:predicted molibdopterin-dependent oxidoreductase YjgC
VEDTDVVFLWGSNARETHPIFFHHLLKGIHNGAKLVSVDPRFTTSAQWADLFLRINSGTDIALANAMAREIIHAGLANDVFVARATSGFDVFRDSVEPFTLEYAERETGIPAESIREAAHLFARADRAMICWTLGITEHHTAVDNVLSLINLCLLTGHVGRYGSGVNPLRGQNNVQGGGDMGAIPNRFVGFQDITDPEVCAKFERAWGVPVKNEIGLTMTQMFDAMGKGKFHSLFVIGENPVQSDADQNHVVHLMENLEHLVVFDIFMTKTAELAHVVLPSVAGWCESEGTVTNSERRVQRIRKALEPPGDARQETWVISEIARRLGFSWGQPSSEDVWNEVREVAAHMFGGMSYERLEREKGLQWPCPDLSHPGTMFLHERLWAEPLEGRPAPFSVTLHERPVEQPDEEYPFILTTGRRLSDYNTGVQSGGFDSPLRRSESVDMHKDDVARLGFKDGELVRITSRRGSIVAPVRIDASLRPGLVFMTFHFQDKIKVNLLTINVTDPKAGTAEFKACAVRIDPLEVGAPGERNGHAVAENGDATNGQVAVGNGKRVEATPAGAPGD